MLFSDKRTPEQRHFLHAVLPPALITLTFILVFILERGLDADFHKAGIMPRDLNHSWSILSYIFIHADWGHLLNNSISFFVLAACLFYFYKQLSYSVLFISWLLSGVIRFQMWKKIFRGKGILQEELQDLYYQYSTGNQVRRNQ